MSDLTLSNGSGISWKVKLVLFLLLVLGILFLIQMLSFTADGGGSGGGPDPCKSTQIATAALEASINIGLSYFVEGGAFHGLSPATITRDQMSQRLYGFDYQALTREQKLSVLDHVQHTGNMRARYTEHVRGECWTFSDPTLMGRILNLFNK